MVESWIEPARARNWQPRQLFDETPRNLAEKAPVSWLRGRNRWRSGSRFLRRWASGGVRLFGHRLVWWRLVARRRWSPCDAANDSIDSATSSGHHAREQRRTIWMPGRFHAKDGQARFQDGQFLWVERRWSGALVTFEYVQGVLQDDQIGRRQRGLPGQHLALVRLEDATRRVGPGQPSRESLQKR